MDRRPFELISPFQPKGDQPKAIKKIVDGIKKGYTHQTLLGVTGSGKTFTISNVIAQVNKPVLVMAHNKTLAAQLYHEFKEFFPKNRVEYFVSYYDYYQPEAYLPKSDTYIEKDMAINMKLELLRLSATQAILTRSDTIIVASVSCIYGLGNPEIYNKLTLTVTVKQKISRKELIIRILNLLYERSDIEIIPGKFRVKGDVIDIVPAYSEDILRIELFGDEIERIAFLDKHTLEVKETLQEYSLLPAQHYATDKETKIRALASIRKELDETLPTINDPLVRHRLKQRVNYDMEIIETIGHCKGIENYSRHFDGRKPGEPPYCLLDYFPDDFLMIIDESHQTLPQIKGMYNGDRARKESLIQYGFRLPSAFDNRPLKFDEFNRFQRQVIYVSATPGDYEQKHSQQIVEQIIRPTGLLDPVIIQRPIQGQINDLTSEIRNTTAKGYRVLITTLTKRMAEELTEFLSEKGIRVRYLHSEIDTLERTEIIRQLRANIFDVLVGINLLREGMDIPEVALVAILDADKEGFLRNERSLIQTIGRAARNADSKVILYRDKETDSIKKAVNETERRRSIQMAYNKKHNVTPQTIIKSIRKPAIELKDTKHIPKNEIPKIIKNLTDEMERAADSLNFELAIKLRDRVRDLEKKLTQ